MFFIIPDDLEYKSECSSLQRSQLHGAEHAVTYSGGWVRKGSERITKGLKKTNESTSC